MARALEGGVYITTESIQKCLDENHKLIMAIVENQSQGRLSECTMYQERLQQNLIFLAKIADSKSGRSSTSSTSSTSAPSISSSSSSSSSSSEKKTSLISTNTPPTSNLVSSGTYTPTSTTTTTSSTTMRGSGSTPPSVYPSTSPSTTTTTSIPIIPPTKWTRTEHQLFVEATQRFGAQDIKAITNHVKTKTINEVTSYMANIMYQIRKQRAKLVARGTPKTTNLASSTTATYGTTSTLNPSYRPSATSSSIPPVTRPVSNWSSQRPHFIGSSITTQPTTTTTTTTTTTPTIMPTTTISTTPPKTTTTTMPSFNLGGSSTNQSYAGGTSQHPSLNQ